MVVARGIENLVFGDEGTESWFGGPGTAEVIRRDAQLQIDLSMLSNLIFPLMGDTESDFSFTQNWARRNAWVALKRRNALASEHPFRANDAELLAIIAQGISTLPSSTDLAELANKLNFSFG